MSQVEPTAKQTFVVCITVDCVTVRQPDTNLRMNHARVYVNRTRAKYTHTPGTFTSSIREEVPTLSLHSAGSFNGYHTHKHIYLLDARGYFEILYHSMNLTFDRGHFKILR